MYALTASFSLLPWPASPSHTVLRPIAENAGLSLACAAGGPEARISSCPVSAEGA